MNGKEKCNLLRQIRKEIAEANNIVYLTADCSFEGDCKGTCPKCDAEIKYLENELNEKVQRGEKISLKNISMNTYLNNLVYVDLDDEVEETNIKDIVDDEFYEPVMGEMISDDFVPRNRGLSLLIEDLELSPRIYNCLKRANIETIEDLNDYEVKSKLSNKTLNEVKKAIYKKRLELDCDDYD